MPERVLIILDEAYFEYAQDNPRYPDSMHYRYDNVITLRTFSKAYGLAGFRVGYGFAHDELIGNLLKVKAPFEPSSAAQAAGLAALGDDDFMRRTVELTREGMTTLRSGLEKLGVTTLPSAANFFVMDLRDPETAQRVSDQLLQRGVMVRPLAGWGWPTLVRVSIGLPEENSFFLEKMSEILRKG